MSARKLLFKNGFHLLSDSHIRMKASANHCSNVPEEFEKRQMTQPSERQQTLRSLYMAVCHYQAATLLVLSHCLAVVDQRCHLVDAIIEFE